MAKLSKTQLKTNLALNFADNTEGDISAEDLREITNDIVDSFAHTDSVPADFFGSIHIFKIRTVNTAHKAFFDALEFGETFNIAGTTVKVGYVDTEIPSDNNQATNYTIALLDGPATLAGTIEIRKGSATPVIVTLTQSTRQSSETLPQNGH